MSVLRAKQIGRVLLSLLAAAHLSFRREFAHLSVGGLCDVPALRNFFLTEFILLLIAPLVLWTYWRTKPQVPGLRPALLFLAYGAGHGVWALTQGGDVYLTLRQSAMVGYVVIYLAAAILWNPAADRRTPGGGQVEDASALMRRTALFFCAVSLACALLDVAGIYARLCTAFNWEDKPFGQTTLPLGMLAAAVLFVAARSGKWRAAALIGLLFLSRQQAARLQSVVPLGIFLATFFLTLLGLALFIRYRRKNVLARAFLILGLFVLLLAGAFGLSHFLQTQTAETESGTEFHSWRPAAYSRLWHIHQTTEIPKDELKTSRRPPYVPVADNEDFYKLEAVFAAEPSQAVRNNMWRFLVWRQMALDWRQRGLLFGAGVGHPWFCRGMYESAFNYGEDRLGLDPHNSYLHLLYRQGLSGFILFLLTVFFVLRAAWCNLSMAPQGDPLLEGLFFYWSYAASFALVTVALEGPSYAFPFWMTLGLIAAYAPARRTETTGPM